jgi:hypothetical protein
VNWRALLDSRAGKPPAKKKITNPTAEKKCKRNSHEGEEKPHTLRVMLLIREEGVSSGSFAYCYIPTLISVFLAVL